MSAPSQPRHLIAARLIAASGIVMLSAGAALVYPPAGLIVAGACLTVIGIGALR